MKHGIRLALLMVVALGLAGPAAAQINYYPPFGSTFVGGTLTSPLLLPDGSVAAPAYSFTGDTDTGLFRRLSNLISFTASGTGGLEVGSTTVRFPSNSSVGWTTGSVTTTNQDVILSRDAANTLALKNSTNNQYFRIYGSSGTTYLQISEASTQGSKTKALTESSATQVASIALAASAHAGGTLHYCVYATDATDFQNRCGKIEFAAVNKAGTTTCVMFPATVNETTDSNAGALSAGTLTYAVTCNDVTNAFDFKFNAVSSLTQTVLQAEVRFDKLDVNTITYP